MRRRRKTRRAVAAQTRINEAFAYAHAHQLSPLWVVQVTSRNRRGAKAIVADETGWRRDAWFWWYYPDSGDLLLCAAETGWGPHTQREGVVYVGGEQTGSGVVHRIAPADLKLAAWLTRRQSR